MNFTRSSRLRIAFVVDKCAPYFVGGYEKRVFALAEALSARHDVAVFTSLDIRTATLGGLTYFRVAPTTFQRESSGRRSWVHSALFAIAIARRPIAIELWRPDVIILQSIPYIHLGTSARWIRRSRYPVVLDVCEAWSEYRFGGTDVGRLVTFLIFNLLRNAARRSDAIVAISRATRDSLIRRYGIPVERVTTIPLGIPLQTVTVATDSHQAKSPIDVIFVNRLVTEKRPLDIVTALWRLRTKYNWNGYAVIVGGGPLLSEVRHTVKLRGLSGNVEVTGFVDESRKVELLNRARLFVLPSEREGFSLAALEALGSGVPVVAARPPQDEVFGVADLVKDGVNGVLYPLGKIEHLVDTLWRLLSDEDRRADMARNARNTANHYSIQAVTTHFESILYRVVLDSETHG